MALMPTRELVASDGCLSEISSDGALWSDNHCNEPKKTRLKPGQKINGSDANTW